MKTLNKSLHAALFLIFRPLARILLHEGVNWKSAVDLLKTAFVQAAIEGFGKNGRPASQTRTAEITGLSRREVRRLLDQPNMLAKAADHYAANESEVLAQWYSRDEFLDEEGMPLDIDFGPGPGSFTQLVEDSLRQCNASDVFNRLALTGCVQMTHDGKIHASRRDLVTNSNLPMLMIDTIGALATTIDTNWRHPDQSPLPHRVVFTTKIDPSKFDVARRSIKQRIVRFAEELDDYLIELETDNPAEVEDTRGDGLIRIGVGTYYFEIRQPGE